MSQDKPTTYNILFVCTGNTCRSPLAEVIARQALEARGWGHVSVDSAGTSAVWGAPASEGSLTAAAEKLVQSADIVLAMTSNHVQAVEAMGEDALVSLLSEFIDGPEAGEPIADPIGGSVEDYAEARERIARAVEGLLVRLSAILSP
jgi:protein-tyrosine phosphatase